MLAPLYPSHAQFAINAVSPALKKHIEKTMKTTHLLSLSIALIAGSLAGAARAETGLLLVCNKGDRTLSVINPGDEAGRSPLSRKTHHRA